MESSPTAAQGGQSQAFAPFLHGVKQGDHDPGAGGADRVAQPDAGAVDIGDVPIQPEFPFAAYVLGGKGFVDFHEFEVGDLEATALREVAHGRNRREAHDRGVAAAFTRSYDPGQRFEAEFGCLFRGHQDHSRGAVVDAAGVAGCDDTGFGHESRRQFLQLVQGKARPEMFVLFKKDRIFLAPGNFHGNDFILEGAVVGRPFGIVLAAQGDFIALFTGNAQVLGNELGCVAHDVGFALEKTKGRFIGVHRTILGVRDDVGTAVQAPDEPVHKFVVLQPTAPSGGRYDIGYA